MESYARLASTGSNRGPTFGAGASSAGTLTAFTSSHAAKISHGFATFDVEDQARWLNHDSVRYHRTLNPGNPAGSGKMREFDSFTLRRRRRDGERERERKEAEPAVGG